MSTVAADQPVLRLSTARRYLVLVTIVVACGAFNAATAYVTASTTKSAKVETGGEAPQ